MNYKIEIVKTAQKQFKALPEEIKSRMVPKLRALSANPYPPDCKKLKNTNGSYRIRVGDYRIIYGVSGCLVEIGYIDHRKDVYRR